jgi:hypothetical protein
VPEPLPGLGGPEPEAAADRPVPSFAPDQFIAHCPAGHIVRGTAEQFNAGRGWLTCGCGLQAPAQRLNAENRPGTACTARCHRAKHTQCHCACAGRNHGTALTYTPTREKRTHA